MISLSTKGCFCTGVQAIDTSVYASKGFVYMRQGKEKLPTMVNLRAGVLPARAISIELH